MHVSRLDGTRMLGALHAANVAYHSGSRPKELFDSLLIELLALTESEYGFVGEILHDDQGPHLRTWAITDISWNDETQAFYRDNAPDGLVFRNLHTLFGHTLATGELVISNDPATDPRGGGLPPGHPSLDAYMGLPIYVGSDLVGMAGLANRPGGYDQELYEELAPFLATSASLINAYRVKRSNAAMDAELLASRNRLSAVVNSAATAILTADRRGTITSANPAVRSIFGYDPDELLGKNLSMLMPEPDCSSHDGYLERYLAGGEPQIIQTGREVRALRSDGTTAPVHLAVSEFTVDGETHFAGIISDLTQIKETERQLIEAKERAEAAVEAKGSFLATVSHEIRTPMNGILGTLGLMDEERLPEKQRAYLGVIRASAESLLTLINDLLDFSKIRAGRVQLEEVAFDPFQVAREVAHLFTAQSREKGVSLGVILEGASPARIFSDVARVRQVLRNLVSNAVRFTDEGTIVLSVSSAPTRDPNRLEMTFSVTDSGIGIANEKMEDIFSPFSQADPSISRKYGGTGLGLAISRDLAEALGGSLSATSDIGSGSAFTFRFEASTDTAEIPSGQHIVIDPDADRRRALVTRIRELGALAIPSESAQGALEILAGGASFSTMLVARDEMAEAHAAGLTTSMDTGICVVIDPGVPDLSELVRCGWSGSIQQPPSDLELVRVLTANPPSTASDAQKGLPTPLPQVQLDILIAEDHPTNRIVLQAHVERYAHELRLVSTGDEAIRAVEARCPDVILMDVRMPGMDGVEAARRIRESMGSAAPAIVFLTADVLPETLARCWRAGATDILKKPLEPELLAATLSRIEPLSQPEIFDESRLLGMLSGDRSALRALLRQFASTLDQRVRVIEDSIEREDVVALTDEAHGLRSAAGMLGAVRLAAIAHELDTLPPETEWAAREERGNAMTEALSELAVVINGVLAQGSPDVS